MGIKEERLKALDLIDEYEFEQKVIQALSVLGWKEYLGDFEIRPSFKIGAANSISPDFIIKSES